MKFSRILSSRHFSWLIKSKDHFTSLRNLIFLVKDVKTKTFSWTQYYNPSLKPISVYLHGFDITRFLTHRSTLTNYSYYFINYVYSIGFTIHDVRSYFNGFTRVTSAQPDIKKLTSRGVKRPYQRTPIATKAMDSATAARESDKPFDSDSVGFRMYQKYIDNPGSTTIKKPVDDKFSDSRLFTAAWKLACLHLLPFKFADTKVELYLRLKAAGFTSSVLTELRYYITETLGNVDFVTLVNDTARQFGFSRSGARSNVELISNEFSLRTLDAYGSTGFKAVAYADFLARLFPEVVDIPLRSD